jgi:tryptophan halogenase
MMRSGPIASVVVAGGGIVGWSAAAAIKRNIRKLRVTVVASAPPEDALADRVGSTLPSIIGFHADLGLTEADTVARARSGYRLGTRFEGWAADRPAYVHSYASHGKPFGTTSFHLHWVRSARRGAAHAFDSYSPAAMLGRAGRFAHPQDEAGSALAGFEYGLQLNVPRYQQMMRAFALHLGVEERRGGIAEIRLHGDDGFVEALRLDDGSEAAGDLFVDCTGPAARIRSSLDGRFDDWGHWLLCDRIIFAEAPPPAEPPVLDEAIAAPAGWRWEAASPARTSSGLVYASAHQSDDEAGAQLGEAAPIGMKQGRRPQPWLRNCVAIGDAAVAVEPLEWTNLHLAHSAIDRIISMMPERDCASIELAEYNRQAEAEADRVRDFLILHYVASKRDGAFWRDAAAIAPPDSLAHTLSLFRNRGRLPFYEEETFSRDSWLAVLLGQGFLPEGVDPLTDLVPPDAAEAAMARMRGALASLPASVPHHSTYLRNLAARAQK